MAPTPALAPAPASLPAAGPGAETPFIPRLGLGLGIDALSLGSFFQDTVAGIPAAPVSIYLPLQVLPFLRLDPSFGAGTYTQNATGGSPYSGYVWTVGLGVLFYVVPPFPFGVYLGPRVSLSFSGSSATDQDGKVTTTTEVDVAVLAAFGAEYFFVRQFGLGAELRLGAYIFGDPITATAAGTTTLDRGRVGFATSGVFFLRYFFY
jgi:hypothetical protein